MPSGLSSAANQRMPSSPALKHEPSSPRIICLFFSDATVPAFLNTATGGTFAGDLLVECGLRPTLSFLLNVETPANYPGVAGLLGGTDVGTLAHPSDRLPAPILLAAGAAVSATAIRSSLEILRRPDERIQAVTLLVPMADARSLGAALAVADRHAIAWNTPAFPHEELVDFARWLGAEKLLTPDNFAGCFAYAPEKPDAVHVQKIAALYAPHPNLQGGLAALS